MDEAAQKLLVDVVALMEQKASDVGGEEQE